MSQNEFSYTRLSSGKIAQVSLEGGQSRIIATYDEEGRPDSSGHLTTGEIRELRQLHAEAERGYQHDRAVATRSDPRHQDTIDRINYTYGDAEREVIDRDPAVFNEIYAREREVVGESLAEMNAAVDRADEIAAITDKLADRAAKNLSQSPEDIARILDLQGLGGKE